MTVNILLIVLYVIVFLLLIHKDFTFLNYDFNDCISLIIPSTELDFLKCYKQFFYVKNRFLYAKEIILAISSVSNTTIIKNIVSNLTVKHKIILGLRKTEHYASSNRNYGALLSNCQIVSFFDIDDMMSVNRLYIMYKTFKYDKTTEFVLHKFTKNCNKLSQNINIHNPIEKYKYNISYNDIYNSYIEKYQNDKPYKRWCCKYIKKIKGEKIHNGWPTMRRYILDRIKYNDSYKVGQDVVFNTNVILSKYNVSILNFSLGYYKQDNNCRDYSSCKVF